jgi:hypothetical protein
MYVTTGVNPARTNSAAPSAEALLPGDPVGPAASAPALRQSAHSVDAFDPNEKLLNFLPHREHTAIRRSIPSLKE